jgi:aryl-alcohol dehydrogenase-like predicted oxidoreductase
MAGFGVALGRMIAAATARTNREGMSYRKFGATGLRVSEVGFGAWGIGSQAYGTVARADSLRALAQAEELGCNFVDTAMVYGDSELVLGEFLRGRRERWIVATKYSGQPAGMTATLETQLRRLGTDRVDFYQIHWAPGRGEMQLYEELAALRRSGKARFIGISLHTIADIERVAKAGLIDGFQVRLSLLDPDPFVAAIDSVRRSGMAVVVRSALKEGFLTGKYRRDAKFPDTNDQRHNWSAEQIARTVDTVERFRFLEREAGSLLAAAISYPLAFPEVSTLILGTKSQAQAAANFSAAVRHRPSPASLQAIARLQAELGLFSRRERLQSAIRRWLHLD